MAVTTQVKNPPLSESFSCDENHHYERKNKTPSRKDLGNDAMSKALNQIFQSPFTPELKEENFLGNSLSQYLPCIMAEQTLWSM